MVDECLQMVTSCLNDFPYKDGISKTLSPLALFQEEDSLMEITCKQLLEDTMKYFQARTIQTKKDA